MSVKTCPSRNWQKFQYVAANRGFEIALPVHVSETFEFAAPSVSFDVVTYTVR